jgi:NADH-quinone oxidoreductase subunit D
MHDFTMPIGPQHPSLKEPTCLRISLKGNYIQEARIRLGYIHRGIEFLLENKSLEKALYIVQRVCGICPTSHSNAFLSAVEKGMKMETPMKVKLMRVIELELERINSHMLWLGHMANIIGYKTLFMFFWKEREHALDIFEKLTGGRIHHNFSKLNSARYDLPIDAQSFMLPRLERIEKKVEDYLNTFRGDSIIKARLRGVGTITKEEARKLCVVGPVARASGVDNDVRNSMPEYKQLGFKPIMEDGCDSMARTLVRLKEVLHSVGLVKEALQQMPKEKLPEWGRFEGATFEATGRSEAPRGEDFHFIKAEKGMIKRAKIRTPTFANIISLEGMLLGREVADVPVILGSLDPCFACMERVMVVKDGKAEEMKEEEFKRKYVGNTVPSVCPTH